MEGYTPNHKSWLRKNEWHERILEEGSERRKGRKIVENGVAAR